MNIIELAKNAGFGQPYIGAMQHELKRFAALVRAEALEEAAELGDSFDPLQDGAIAAAIRGLK